MEVLTIAIEGSDGAGKATQTEKLARHLSGCGLRVGRVSFPRYKETPVGRMLAEFLKSPRAMGYDFANAHPKLASRIYAQDRYESLKFINNLIAGNDVVIFDRYVESNLLHQGGKLRSDSEMAEFAKWLTGLEYEELCLPRPEITIYLDLPYTISLERARRRAEEKGESPDVVESNSEYLERSWRAGKIYAAMLKWRVIDCIIPHEQNQLRALRELTPDEIHARIRRDVIDPLC